MNQATRLAIMTSILAIAVRFIWINQAFVDHWSWRQSDVAAIARNYFEGGFHFARPQIDWAGDQAGYVGTEFPILPFLAALAYKIFGVHEWVGRVQAVILFALSLPFFFLLVRNWWHGLPAHDSSAGCRCHTAAVWALFFYSFAPLGIVTSRCFMPDMPSLALSIAGLFFFERWIRSEPDWQLRSTLTFVASALCVSLSILVKATSVLIAAPIACLIFQQFGVSVFQRFKLWLFAAIALLPSAIWYWHAYQVSLEFYPHHFFGAGGVKIMSLAWYWDIAKQIPTSEMTPILFLLGVFGVWQARACPGRQPNGSTSNAGPFQWWLAAMIGFIFIVGFGNRHPWYRLPLVPVFAAFAGAACAFFAAKIPNRAIRILLSVLLIALFGFSSFVYARQLYQPTAAPMRDAGLVLKVAEPSALIVAADNGDPTIFYYAGRKGWHFLEKDGIYNGEPIDSAQAIVDLEALRKRGATFLVFTSNTSWWLDYYEQLGQYVASNATLLEKSQEFKIYKLNPISQ
jgi:4-amino-4-deoxy-L-arabinose transferase-like glycosyltransferase